MDSTDVHADPISPTNYLRSVRWGVQREELQARLTQQTRIVEPLGRGGTPVAIQVRPSEMALMDVLRRGQENLETRFKPRDRL